MGGDSFQRQGEKYLFLDSADGPLELGIGDPSSNTLIARWKGAASGSTVEDLQDGLAEMVGICAPSGIAGIIIAQGPGSFTGLRIGYSFVVGLASVWGCPLIEVPSLDAYAAAVPAGWGVVIGDARRGEYFSKCFLWRDGLLLGDAEPVIRSPQEIGKALRDWSEQSPELFSSGQLSPFVVGTCELLGFGGDGERNETLPPTKEREGIDALLAELQCSFPLISGKDTVPVSSRVGAMACLLSRTSRSAELYPHRPIETVAPLYVRSIAAKTVAERTR
jgi:tRNA threonylcarbamoyl adenosine modification protein YeaZ